MTPIAAMLVLLMQLQATSTELGYRFPLPAGFAAFPEGQGQADIVDCWSETATDPGTGPLVLCVQRLHGVLPREAIRAQDVPASAQVVDYKWKGFDIQGVRLVQTQDGRQVFALVAQVPLKPEAVQLLVSGPVDAEARGRALMDSTLAVFEGDSNWLSDTERAGRLGRIAGTWIAIGVGLAFVLWMRRRRATGTRAQ